MKRWPDILTIRWWRWCLAHGWNGLARERIRLYYVRRIKYKVLRYPICLVKKHQPYETASWGWNATMCKRCHRTLRYQRHPRVYPESRRKWM